MPRSLVSPLAVRSISPIIVRHCTDYFNDPLPIDGDHAGDPCWPTLHNSSLDSAYTFEVKRMMDVEYSPAGDLASRTDAGCNNCFHNACPGGTWGTPCGHCLVGFKSDCSYTSRVAFVSHLRNLRDEYIAVNDGRRSLDENLHIFYANCKLAFVVFDQSANVARFQFSKGVRSHIEATQNPFLVMHMHLLALSIEAHHKVIAALEERYNYLTRTPFFPARFIEGWL
ncbi:hypothetical protein FB45DRAFT_876147 [Roridomyces roridus]|uniref:Uncharacterized protein n=1 Tax=Roridomyces roridus TaxID=1738132 RepID=A0AAD7FC03_9AGAR|nr:hypothetical protein FB45DRAFT_876147 [Roridomyces roridus]